MEGLSGSTITTIAVFEPVELATDPENRTWFVRADSHSHTC